MKQLDRRWKVLLVTSIAVFMAFLDVTIVNVAFPSVREAFPDTSLAGLSWVLNAYNIVFAALLVPAGRLAPRADDLDRLAGAGDDGARGDPRAQAAESRAPGPGRPVTSRAVRGAPQVSQMRCSSTWPPQSLWTRTIGGPSGA